MTWFDLYVLFSPQLVQLKSDRELDKIKGLKLVELWLNRNPLCDFFKDQASYIRSVSDFWGRGEKIERTQWCDETSVQVGRSCLTNIQQHAAKEDQASLLCVCMCVGGSKARTITEHLES